MTVGVSGMDGGHGADGISHTSVPYGVARGVGGGAAAVTLIEHARGAAG